MGKSAQGKISVVTEFAVHPQTKFSLTDVCRRTPRQGGDSLSQCIKLFNQYDASLLNFIRYPRAFFYLADITDESSFEKAKFYVHELKLNIPVSN